MKKVKINKILKNRKIMYSTLAFSLVAIITMTIAYAILNTTLEITGTAELQRASWNITVEEIEDTSYYDWEKEGFLIKDNTVYKGDGKVITHPSISGTSINNYQVSLTKPGDMIVLLYKITNTGNIPAVFESISRSTPEITSSTNSQEDIELVQSNYWMEYAMFELFYNNEVWSDGETVSEGYVLCPGAMLSLELPHAFNDTTMVPNSTITISNLNANITFTAGDRNLCNGSTPVASNE